MTASTVLFAEGAGVDRVIEPNGGVNGRSRSINRVAARTSATLVVGLSIGQMTSCVAVPEPSLGVTRDRIEAPDRYRSLYYPRDAGVDGVWIDDFADESLASHIEEALQANPDLERFAAVRDQVRAATRLAQSTLLPRLDGVGALERDQDSDGSAELLTLEFAVGWEIDLWGRLRAGHAASISDAAATDLEYSYFRQSLSALVAELWFTAIAAEGVVEINRERERWETTTAEAASRRFEAGVGTPVDDDFAQANLALARDELALSVAVRDRSARTLELLLGRYPAATIEVPDMLPDRPPMPAVGIPAELLERRPDLVAAEARVAAAFHRERASRLARLPRLRLGASAGAEFAPAEGLWRIAADLLAPIFTGGELEAQIEIATAQQRATIAQYVAVALAAFGEVEEALSTTLRLEERSEELELAVERLSAANRTAEARYEAGVLTIFELNQVRQNYFRAKLQRLAVRLELLRQRVRLHLAIGGSFVDVEGATESQDTEVEEIDDDPFA